MATKTSVGSGLWSAAGTWDAGVPVDNDVVVIAAGHVVEFDVDQSGFANGIDGLTITGTLSLTRTAGTYYLKIKAAKTINGVGTFDCGTSVSPIPFAAKHTITGGTGWYIDGASDLTMTVYAAEPVIKYVKLSSAESAGATVLEVDTDVTGDIWADGDSITICNINKAKNVETRTIATGGISTGSITISSGLTASKVAGTYICLCTRNISIICSTSQSFRNFHTDKLLIGGGSFTASPLLFHACKTIITGGVFFANGVIFRNSGTVASVANAVFTNNSDSIYQSIVGNTLSENVLFCGNSNFDTSSQGKHVLNNCVFAGCSYGVVGMNNILNNCSLIGMQYGILGSGTIVNNTTISYSDHAVENFYGTLTNFISTNNSYGFVGGSTFKAFNMTLGSINIYEFQSIGLARGQLSESVDHNGAGGYKVWTRGGTTTSQVSVLPTGYTKAFITVLENATIEGYWQREITVGAGASVNIETQLRKDALMTYLPRAIVFNKASTDPFAGGAGLHTFTMTNSVDTWESDLYTYTNSGTEDVTLVVRIQGMNATGNLYSALDVEQINVDLTGAIAKIDVIDALVDAIKAKTDQLAFSVANQVDANSLTGGLTEGQIRTAIGLAAANLDTQLAVIPTAVENRQEMDSNSTRLASIDGKTTNLPADPADQSAVEAAITAIPAGISVNDILGMQVEGTYTLQQILRIMSSALAGKLSGGGTATLKFRDLQDTLDRITATVDQATGDRDNITLDLS